MSPYMALDEDLIMSQRSIAECHPSHIASSMSPTIGGHESDVQPYTPSMMHTLVGAIDEEIDMVRPLTRSLRPLLSTITPISVLPPELLLRIFRFHALEVPPWSDGLQKLGWIEVTHVCQRWRQVALSDSSLWARITGLSPNARWIAEMLVRSRNVPLAVNFTVTPGPEILSMLPPHTFRIRKLRLCGLSPHVSQGLQEICAWEAPALEHFEIRVKAPYPVTFRQLGGTMLFRGAPKLQKLSISKVSIPWSLIPRGQLTQLKITLIRGVSTPSTPLPSASDALLDLLINSPDLEVLVLEFCLPTILFQPQDGQVIHLPRLSRLRLGGSTSCVANFMKMLQLPSSTTLHLRCLSDDFLTHNANIILPLVSAHFHNPAPLEFRSLRITINSLNGLIDVAASTAHPTKLTISGLDAFEGDTDSELTMSFERLLSFVPLTQGGILEAVFKMLPISNLEYLSISVTAVGLSVNWYELSQRCEKVTTIRASGRGTSGLLRSLAPIKPTKTTSGSKGKKGTWVDRATRAQGAINSTTGARARITPFPKLTSLFLENLNFRFLMAHFGVLCLYDVIAYVLRRRRANNTPLNMLGVDRCVITPDLAKGLKRYVQELRWDGDEGPSFEEWDSDFTENSVDFPPGTGIWVDFYPGTGI